MKSLHNTNVIRSSSASRVSLGLIVGGIVTAILCSLALLNDTRFPGNEDGRLPELVEVSTVSRLNVLFNSKPIIGSIKSAIHELHNSLLPIN